MFSRNVARISPAFNYRRFSPAPGGELRPAVQTRIVAATVPMRAAHPGQAVALFSHGDAIRSVAIRSAVAYFGGVPLALVLRIEIRPASISSGRFSGGSLPILGVSDTGELYA
jgi:broad specificity phosphatase PhoE